jgi:exodeoxyribonuclease VII small subunit
MLEYFQIRYNVDDVRSGELALGQPFLNRTKIPTKANCVADRQNAASKEDDPKTFEEAFRELEGGVRNLEKGNLGLEESLAVYEKAIAHLRYCMKQLEQARRRVELLQGVSDSGTAETIPFDDESLDFEEKQNSRSRRRTSNAASESAKSKRVTDVD